MVVTQATDDIIIRRMRFAWWITKATDTLRIAIPWGQWLCDCDSTLRYKFPPYRHLGQVKFPLLFTMKAQRCSRGITTLSLTSAPEGGMWLKPRLGRSTHEARWAPGPVWTGAENLAPTRIQSPYQTYLGVSF
jgi:hypothetical protein